jgi:hypothetical protein
VLEDPDWASSVNSAPAEASTEPDAEVVNNPEADAVQDIVNDFLVSQNLTPQELSPDNPIQFSVEHLDELLVPQDPEDAGQTIRARDVVMRRRDDPDDPHQPGTETHVSFDTPRGRVWLAVATWPAPPARTTVGLFAEAQPTVDHDEHQAAPSALEPIELDLEDRIGIYLAMRGQLLPDGPNSNSGSQTHIIRHE